MSTAIAGGDDIQIEGLPTPAEWVVLAIVAAALPLSVLVGWLVPRLSRGRVRASQRDVPRRPS